MHSFTSSWMNEVIQDLINNASHKTTAVYDFVGS
jgi:hypothetical protein